MLHVGSLTPREFTAEDRELLQLAADRAALAIEHAHLYAQERNARLRLEALQRVTDAALAYLPEDELLPELLERVAAALNSDTAAILLLEPSGELLRARAAKGIEEEVEQGVTIPVGGGFAGRIAAERRPIFIPDVDHADILNPILREKGIRSLLGVPLLVEGRVIGVLHVGTLTPREFTADDTELLQLAADRAAPTIENARLFEQRRVAEVLQRTLLPTELPSIAGLEVATRYVPAEGTGLGGDWYDVFELPESRIAIAVGDVVGHGVAAAAVMAQLRTALRAYAAEGHDPARRGAVRRPADVAARADGDDHAGLPGARPARGDARGRQRRPPAAAADRARRRARGYLERRGRAAAGHLADRGLRQPRSCRSRPAARSCSSPTGSSSGAARRSTSGWTGCARICVGRRGRRAAVLGGAGRARAAQAPADDVAHGGRAHAAADRRPSHELAGDPRGARERAPHPAPLAGVPRRRARRSCTTSSSRARRRAPTPSSTPTAPGTRYFDVDAEHREARIRVTVRDHGHWRPPRGSHRGRGLPLMRALMDSVDVDHGTEGTVVVLERTLRSRSAA